MARNDIAFLLRNLLRIHRIFRSWQRLQINWSQRQNENQENEENEENQTMQVCTIL